MSNMERFLGLLAEIFGTEKEEIGDAQTPDDIENWDSITHMDLMARFEEEFGVEFDMEEITEMETVGLIKEALIRHGVKL